MTGSSLVFSRLLLHFRASAGALVVEHTRGSNAETLLDGYSPVLGGKVRRAFPVNFPDRNGSFVADDDSAGGVIDFLADVYVSDSFDRSAGVTIDLLADRDR